MQDGDVGLGAVVKVSSQGFAKAGDVFFGRPDIRTVEHASGQRDRLVFGVKRRMFDTKVQVFAKVDLVVCCSFDASEWCETRSLSH